MSQPFVVEEWDYRDLDICNDAIKANGITYVAGYLAAKALKRHPCETCQKCLISSDLDDTSKMFCLFKAYESKTKTFGGLTVPNKDFVAYVTQTKDIIMRNFSNVMCRKGVAKALTAKLPLYLVTQCPDFPSEFMRKLYVRLCIHYIWKFGNHDIASGKRKNKKYLKLQHL